MLFGILERTAPLAPWDIGAEHLTHLSRALAVRPYEDALAELRYGFEQLGYNPRDATAIRTVTSVLGVEPGYEIPVHKFSALGFEFSDFIINAHDLRSPLTSTKAGLEGLDQMGPLTPGQAKVVELSIEDISTLIGMISDLLNIG